MHGQWFVNRVVGRPVLRGSGEISRADVAAACVAALANDETKNATFEVYETKRRYGHCLGAETKAWA
jgi:hypothetical protein